MTASNTYGRQVVLPLTNKSGGGVIAGDVVIVDTANNDAFTTTTSAGSTALIGIAQGTIGNNAVGLVLIQGYAALVNVNASVTRGNYGATHSVAKQAADAGASRAAGTFCQFLTAGTTPDAVIYPSDLSGGAGAPTTADYLTGTAQGGLSAEIVVGTTPGGELGGTWASPTVDATHSGSPHAKYAILEDQKAQNTGGGTFTSGAWQTRVLNTEVSDASSIVTLASNQFTPISGTYLVLAYAQSFDVSRNQARIENVTAATTAVTGLGNLTLQNAGVLPEGPALVNGIFTANGTDAYELQHKCEQTKATDGFGIAVNLTTEVFAQVILIKIA